MKLALVPTLGVLALVSSAANAQEVAKGLFLDGWADNVAKYTTQDNAAGGGASLATQKTDLVDFSANAKIKLSWKPTDKITGFVGVKFNNGSTDAAYLQESYAAVNVGSDLTWTMGKYIAHVGYVSAEPTGLYRVNGSTIGALLYTNDVVGTNLAWAPKDIPFSGSFHIVNGFFTPGDTFNDTSATTDHKRSDLGLGLDLIYTLPDSKGFINLEFAWDPSSSAGKSAAGYPSDIFLAGLNGEFNATDKLKFGSEFIYKASKNADVDDAGKPVDKADVEFLAMANYKLPTTLPASTTLMYQQLNENFAAKATQKPVVHEISAAILTNPFGSDKLGINGEIAYAFVDGDNKANVMDGQTTISLEALVVIP